MPRDNQTKYFIDIHCHLFNVEHVPLRQTIRRLTQNFNKGLAKKGISAAGAGALGSIVGPILAIGSNAIAKRFYKIYEAFIRFFDQPIQDNIKDIVGSIKKLGSTGGMDGRKRLFTPLIMDFELCEGYKRLASQVIDLSEAIASSRRLLNNNNTIILPFLGMDLRRFHGDLDTPPATALSDFLHACGVTFKPASERQDITQLVNGDFVGIKLYPSLGFDVLPEDRPIRGRNVAILKRLKQLDIPITVHCQISSYECDPGNLSNQTLINYANPEKWWKLIGEFSSLRDLRINFAHFGGEEGVAKVLMWNDEVPDPEAHYSEPGELFPGSWTYWIIKLIKTYPNAFADISAFDFEDKKAVASLAWLMARDRKGEYNALGRYRLLDKLMFGSDVPMILSDHGTYKKLFDAYYAVLDFQRFDTGNYWLPSSSSNLPGRDELFERLVDTNPSRFLFGG